MTRLDASKFLEDLTGRFAASYTRAIDDWVVALATGNAVQARAAKLRYNDIVRETMGVGEILGAMIVFQQAAALGPDKGAQFRRVHFADDVVQNILPRVTFNEAVEDLATRVPVTLENAAERNAQAISKLYSEGRVIAFARSAEKEVTEKAQRIITDMLREGVPEVDAGRRLVKTVEAARKRSEAWSASYSRMVFRTNVNTAVQAGTFRTLRDPDIKRIMPAVEFLAVGDADTRDNHDAADGVVMSTDDPRWNHLAPPLGYNCRCDVRGVGVAELRRSGRVDERGNFVPQSIPARAGPDEGFRQGTGRPDILTAEASRLLFPGSSP